MSNIYTCFTPQRTIPAAAKVISVVAKKDEVEVIFPEYTVFEWNASLIFPVLMLIFHRVGVQVRGDDFSVGSQVAW